MRQSPLLAFNSSAFPVTLGEDEDTDPGIYGKALAHWLAQQLLAQGFALGEVISEDFGWCVPVWSKSQALYVACASSDNTQDSWRIFAFVEGSFVSRLLGKDRSPESLVALFAVLKRVLESSPQIQNLREEDAA